MNLQIIVSFWFLPTITQKTSPTHIFPYRMPFRQPVVYEFNPVIMSRFNRSPRGKKITNVLNYIYHVNKVLDMNIVLHIREF